VLPEWVGYLPSWLLVGVGGGLAVAVVVAGVFVVASRRFPTPPPERGPRIDGLDRRRDEIRTYLGSLGERYVEDAVVSDETVAFYLPERDVAITFDPQAFFRVERAGTDAVLCEYEMPATQLGDRLPFETPGRGGAATEPADARRAFAQLGLAPTADAEAVRTAYRQRVKDVHPDQGGDRESFRALQEAYATATEYAE